MKIRNTVLVFSLLGAGVILPLQGAACVSGTVASYVALGATGCTINGSWTFSNFAFRSFAAGVTTPSGGMTTTDETIAPLSGLGVGLDFTPTVPWTATGGGNSDVEIQYIVAFTGNITSIFQSIFGSIVPDPSGGFLNITDDYCPGGTTLPPGGCAAGVQVLDTNVLSSTPGGTASNTASFAAVHSVAVLKDTSTDSTGFPGSSDAITAYTNCFNGTCTPSSTVPEPGSSGLAGLGLGLGLIALGSVKLRRSA